MLDVAEPSSFELLRTPLRPAAVRGRRSSEPALPALPFRLPAESAAARRAGPTYRRALEERLERWEAFGRLLRTAEERRAFARLTRSARRHFAEASYVGSPDLLESIMLSVLLDLSRGLPAPARGTRPARATRRRPSRREFPSRARARRASR